MSQSILLLNSVLKDYFEKVLLMDLSSSIEYFFKNLDFHSCFACRSSHRRCSLKIGFLKNFANFKGLSWSLFLIKSQTFRDSQHRCFFAKFMKFLRTPILKNMFELLLLEGLTGKF